MPEVFISSVAKGLEDLREEIALNLRKALFGVVGMEQFGAQPEPSIDVCLRALRQADAVVLIIGPRYGSRLPEQISFTHAEFREARGLGIPILAFKIPWAPDLPPGDRSALDTFLTELGGAFNYDALAPGESEAKLVAKVVAAVSAARSRGQLGRQYSLFQPWKSFFTAQLDPSGASVSHRVPLVGREAPLAQLLQFFREGTPLAFLVAPGGSGKSRLLLEAARTWSKSNELPVLLFVDAGASWDASDIQGLPAVPTVLIIDDAHRRPDLDRLLAACRLRNSEIRFVVSCRPSALETVRSLVASVSNTSAAAKIDLPLLDKTDAVRLAAVCLGERNEFAERLVKIADRNPLVISVGGRAIADNRVPPELLDASEEAFKAAVLDRLLDDAALQGADLGVRRRILEILAAVGPVVAERDDFMQPLATAVTTEGHEVRRHLASLEKSGFVLRRGRLIRVNPDVLADHLLYRAAVDDNGQATGFVEKMIKVFPGFLDNVLANAAELDWRGARTSDHTPVLSATWRDIRALVPSMTYRERADLLKKLKRAAVFAPGNVLTVAQQIAHSSDAPPDMQLREWGFDDDPRQVVDALVEVFGFIAGHQDFTRLCIDELWPFAAIDERSVGPHPDHPRQKLEDLVKYEWRSQWQLPDGVHSRAVEAFLVRFQAADRPEWPWAVALLDKALERLGDATESTRRQLTVSQFSLTSFLPIIGERRRRICDALRAIAVGHRPAEAGAAIRALGELLKRPWGPFGQELKPDEIVQWQQEAETAISFLGDIATSAALQAAVIAAIMAAPANPIY